MRALGRWLTEHWIAVGSPLLLLVAWEWASATGLLREAFFPRPSTIAAHLRQLAADGTLWGHTAMTLIRIGWAFALAAVLGVSVGLAMGLWRRLRDGLDPVFAVIYPIPSVLFLPFVSFLVPPGEIALVVTTAVTSFFLIAFTTTQGVRQIDRLVVEAAVHYGARGWRLFATVLIVVVAVEIVAASRGLGALLWLSWQILKIEDMYATFFVIAFLGALLSYGLAAFRARLLPWIQDVAEP